MVKSHQLSVFIRHEGGLWESKQDECVDNVYLSLIDIFGNVQVYVQVDIECLET